MLAASVMRHLTLVVCAVEGVTVRYSIQVEAGVFVMMCTLRR